MTPEEQARRDRLTAAGLDPNGPAYVANPTNTITTASIAPTPTLNYATPTQDATTPINYDTLFQLTQPEKQASDLTSQITSLQNQLIGESAYRTSQETTQGLPELQKTEADLTARLKALQNEALAIPNQMQNSAEGRGITAGGLAPLQASKIRNNAIQALEVSSLLSASQGKIATALDMIDRAVASKYNPIKEAIQIKLDNLNLITKSPEYTLAEKKRAEDQIRLQEAEKTKTDKEATDRTAILNMALKALQNGVDSVTLRAIQGAKTPEEAMVLAGQYLNDTESWSTPYLLGGDYVQKNNRTGEVRVAVNVPVGTGVSGTSPLSVLDIARYQELYPNAGIVAGDTEAVANSKAAKYYGVREYTDEELRILARDDKNNKATYEQVLAAIETSPTILNKDRARLIAAEIYGKPVPKTTTQSFSPTPTTSTTSYKYSLEPKPIPTQSPISVQGGTTTGSFFSNLFGS